MVGTAAMVVSTGTFAAIVTVTAVEAFLATTKNVTAILTAVIVVTETAIGAEALLVVIRLIIASAGVTPAVLPVAVAQLVRQGTLMPPTKAPAGKFAFHYMST